MSGKKSENIQVPKENQYTEKALSRLKEAGFRITMPRVQVIRAISGSQKALTTQQIYEQVLLDGGRTDLVSVYRTLQTLLQLHLVHHIGAVDGFHPCSFEEEHTAHSEHLVCTHCKKVEERCSHGDEAPRQESPFGDFVVESYRVEILGKCGSCQRSQA